MIHDFHDDLDYSEDERHEPFWRAIYKKAYPTLVNSMTAWGDHECQRKGIDRIIILASGEIIRLDQKQRREVYPDFALEYVSNNRTGTPGWMEKDLHIDELAYAFMPITTVYLLPWKPLKAVWEKHKEKWKKIYFHIPGKNYGYTTYSLAVPISVICNLIKGVRKITVIEQQEEEF